MPRYDVPPSAHVQRRIKHRSARVARVCVPAQGDGGLAVAAADGHRQPSSLVNCVVVQHFHVTAWTRTTCWMSQMPLKTVQFLYGNRSPWC